jgi:hypothetical protein
VAGLDERATYYLLESGRLGDAAKKIGKQYVSSPRKIRAALGLDSGVAS